MQMGHVRLAMRRLMCIMTDAEFAVVSPCPHRHYVEGWRGPVTRTAAGERGGVLRNNDCFRTYTHTRGDRDCQDRGGCNKNLKIYAWVVGGIEVNRSKDGIVGGEQRLCDGKKIIYM